MPVWQLQRKPCSCEGYAGCSLGICRSTLDCALPGIEQSAGADLLVVHGCRIDEYTAGTATDAARSGEPLPQLLGNLQKLVSNP